MTKNSVRCIHYTILSVVITLLGWHSCVQAINVNNDQQNLADLAFQTFNLTEDKLEYTIENKGTASVQTAKVTMQWNDEDFMPIGDESAIYWKPTPLGAGQSMVHTIPYASASGNDFVTTYLKNKPANARYIHLVLDSANEVLESNENNNAEVADAPTADLAFGLHSLTEDKLEYTIQNKGTASVQAAKVTMQWGDDNNIPVGGDGAVYWKPAPLGAGQSVTHIHNYTENSDNPTNSYLLNKPANATRLILGLDSQKEVEEKDESNNAVLVFIIKSFLID